MYKKIIVGKKVIIECLECGFKKEHKAYRFNDTTLGKLSEEELLEKECSPHICGTKHYDKLIGKVFKDKTIIGIKREPKDNKYSKYEIKVISKCNVCGLITETRVSNFLKDAYNNQSHEVCRKILFKQHDVKLLQIFHERWRTMIRRCEDKTHKSYNYYSKFGVCKEWHDFMIFYNDMWNDFKLELQLDRIDGTKGYSKENCRWTTVRENALNRSTTKEAYYYNIKTHEIKHFGKNIDSISNFCDSKNNVASTTVFDRLNGKTQNINPINGEHMFFNTKKEMEDFINEWRD